MERPTIPGDVTYPSIDDLLHQLAMLAGRWFESYGDSTTQAVTLEEYNQTLLKLYSLGWDDRLAVDSELPSSVMSAEYKRRNPDFDEDVFAD